MTFEGERNGGAPDILEGAAALYKKPGYRM